MRVHRSRRRYRLLATMMWLGAGIVIFLPKDLPQPPSIATASLAGETSAN